MSQTDKSQKTQKPTDKRIREFRKEGKIALSKDLTSVSLMLFGGAMALSFSDRASQSVATLMRIGLSAGSDTDISVVYQAGQRAFVTACWPVMLGSLLGFLLATGVQLGWPPALKKISFKPGKALGMGAIKQVISPKAALGRMAKATAKAALVMAVLALVIRKEYQDFIAEPAMDPLAIGETLLGAIGSLGFYSVLVLGALALIDYGFQKKKIMTDMMMSMEDIKKEMKQSEGDPKIKGKRKQKMRELAQRRVQANVAGADVVIVNPSHYSVALRYGDQDGAPRVVAKGKDEAAAKIREFARKAGVPIVSRPPLTRLVYRLVPEGREIPPELYQAIAEILAYVFRLTPGRKLG